MKITILGSSGQIGAYLTEYLRGKNHEVTEFDVARHHGEDLTQIPNHNLDRAIKNADFVFFLAFDVGGSRYLKKYQHTFDFIRFWRKAEWTSSTERSLHTELRHFLRKDE